MSTVLRSGLVGAVAALATALGGSGGLRLHDAVGYLAPGRELPVAVVRAEGEDLAGARAAALAAGAGRVFVAGGGAELGEAPPTVEPGADGRVRTAGGQRLPLPEALGPLLVLDAARMGPGTPAGALGGRSVVLVPGDGGPDVLVPGVEAPVDEGVVAAVAIGAAEVGAGLRVAPLPLAVALTGAMAVAVWALCLRLLPSRTPLPGLAAVAASLLLAVLARRLGLDLPVGGMFVAAVVPPFARVAFAAADALSTLDRALLWLGTPPTDQPAPAGLAAIAEMATVWAPGATVAAWRPGPEGSLQRLAHREAPGATLPTPAALPARRQEGADWVVEPVLDRGEVVGALGLAWAHGTPSLAPLAALLARSPQAEEAAFATPTRDPWAARLDLVRVAVRRALRRAARWEGLLGPAGATIGVFDLAGGAVVMSEPMRRAALDPQGGTAPLLRALESLSGRPAEELRARVRAALAAAQPARLPARDPAQELVLSPVGPPEARDGLLVQLVDVAEWRQLDELKTGVVRSVGQAARPLLDALAADVAALATAPLSERAALAAAVERRLRALDTLLGRAEALATVEPGEDPLAPVSLPRTLQEVLAELGPAAARVQVELPEGTPFVSARPRPLARALRRLLELCVELGGARVALRVGEAQTVVVIEDDAGGLPEAVARRWAEDPAGPVAEVRAQVEHMDGRLVVSALPGQGLRYELSLGHF